MKTYHGSCHCGAVRFKASMELSSITQCNCSICSKKGSLHHRISSDNFTLLSGENDLTLYQFDSKEAKHLFCKHCGIHSFSHPRFDPKMISVNVRCLDDFDVQTEKYELTPKSTHRNTNRVQVLDSIAHPINARLNHR